MTKRTSGPSAGWGRVVLGGAIVMIGIAADFEIAGFWGDVLRPMTLVVGLSLIWVPPSILRKRIWVLMLACALAGIAGYVASARTVTGVERAAMLCLFSLGAAAVLLKTIARLRERDSTDMGHNIQT